MWKPQWKSICEKYSFLRKTTKILDFWTIFHLHSSCFVLSLLVVVIVVVFVTSSSDTVTPLKKNFIVCWVIYMQSIIFSAQIIIFFFLVFVHIFFSFHDRSYAHSFIANFLSVQTPIHYPGKLVVLVACEKLDNSIFHLAKKVNWYKNATFLVVLLLFLSLFAVIENHSRKTIDMKSVGRYLEKYMENFFICVTDKNEVESNFLLPHNTFFNAESV